MVEYPVRGYSKSPEARSWPKWRCQHFLGSHYPGRPTNEAQERLHIPEASGQGFRFNVGAHSGVTWAHIPGTWAARTRSAALGSARNLVKNCEHPIRGSFSRGRRGEVPGTQLRLALNTTSERGMCQPCDVAGLALVWVTHGWLQGSHGLDDVGGDAQQMVGALVSATTMER
jgi:hypothetical protein